MTAPALNEDFVDLLTTFEAEGVAFLLVGAFAVAVNGAPRFTGDLDERAAGRPKDLLDIELLREAGAPVDDP